MGILSQHVESKVNLMKEMPDDPVEFCNKYFPLNVDPKNPALGPDLPPLTVEWIRFAWENALNGRSCGIIGPKGFSKTLTAERLALLYILKFRNARVGYVTKSANKSRHFVRAVRKRLRVEKVQKVFGDLKDDENWGAEEFSIKRPGIDKNPTMVGYGVKSNVEGSRFDLLIVDDPTDRNSARYEVERDLVNDVVVKTLIPRVVKGGIIFFILSRWHPYDIGNDLMNMEMFGDRVKVFRAIPDEAVEQSACPEIMTYDDLMSLKSTIGTENFNLIYQQEAASDTVLMFPEPKKIGYDEIVQIGVHSRYMGVDFNASEKEYNDLTAVFFVTLLRDGRMVVDWVGSKHLLRGYGDFIDSELTKSTNSVFPPPVAAYCESIAFQSLATDEISNRFGNDMQIVRLGRSDERNLTKDDVNWNRVSKDDRVRMVMQAPISSGNLLVYYDRGYPRETSDVIYDITHYPDVKKKDRMDAGQMVVRNVKVIAGRMFGNQRGDRKPVMRHR